MDTELIETLRLINERFGDRQQGSVFIPIKDFSWYNHRNRQLTRLKEKGLISQLRFYDDGADISLTDEGRHFFDNRVEMKTLTKERMIRILSALAVNINTSYKDLGYDDHFDYWSDIECLSIQGLILLARKPIHGGGDPRPSYLSLKGAAVTALGLQFIHGFSEKEMDLARELISACCKISDNPVSYSTLDEDGLNRMVRDLWDAALKSFRFSVCDQTQQGIANSRSGELDIRVNQNGIPVAIYEGLIHSSKQYLYEHIDKAIGKYNQSGCKEVFVVEFSRNKNFEDFWFSALRNIKEHPQIDCIQEEDTSLMGVKMLKGKFRWKNDWGEFIYLGVNCCVS